MKLIIGIIISDLDELNICLKQMPFGEYCQENSIQENSILSRWYSNAVTSSDSTIRFEIVQAPIFKCKHQARVVFA